MRATKAIVHLQAVAHNIRQLQRHAPHAQFMAVVKADGYGHGAYEVAQIALATGATFLGVATAEEGVVLRRQGIKAPILVIGALSPADCAACVPYDISTAVFSAAQIEAMQAMSEKTGVPAHVHIKIDSGFHRIGVTPEEVDLLLAVLVRCPLVHVEGMFAHFATADCADDSFVHVQMERFKLAEQAVRAAGHRPIVHVCNSAAMIRYPELACDMVRGGILMYGCMPSAEMHVDDELRPALSWQTEVVALRDIAEGESVGYGRTFIAQKPTRVATLPVGYADGYARTLSNKGQVLIGGKRCPVIGRVCMDQTMVDVTDVPQVQIGDTAVLIGQQGSERITADEMGQWRGTIGYEVLVDIGKRVPREYER